MSRIRALFTSTLALAIAAEASGAQTDARQQKPVAWATVTYLSGQSVYIDAGTTRGLREGSRLEVVRAGSVIANLVVAFVSSTRASCTIESASAAIVVGDSARFLPSLLRRDSTVVADGSPRGTVARARPLHGRLGLRYLAITTPGSGRDVLQPAIDARVEGPLGGPVGVLLDVRAHRTRLTGTSAASSPQGETRVYQAAVQVQGEGDAGRLAIGRQFATAVAPIGLFDGVAADLNFRHWALGALAGSQPDPVRFAYSTLVREYGAWLQVHNAPGTPGIWSITTAAIGSYQGGEVNREFVYAQGVLVTRRVSVFASQELDVNRGWKTDAGEPSTSLTSTFATVRVSPVDAFALSGGFDNRRNVRLYRDWINPEVEFDDSFRRGVWGWRHPHGRAAPVCRRRRALEHRRTGGPRLLQLVVVRCPSADKAPARGAREDHELLGGVAQRMAPDDLAGAAPARAAPPGADRRYSTGCQRTRGRDARTSAMVRR